MELICWAQARVRDHDTIATGLSLPQNRREKKAAGKASLMSAHGEEERERVADAGPRVSPVDKQRVF